MAPDPHYSNYYRAHQNQQIQRQSYPGYQTEQSDTVQPIAQHQHSRTSPNPHTQTTNPYQSYRSQQYTPQVPPYGTNHDFMWETGYGALQQTTSHGRPTETLTRMNISDQGRSGEVRSPAMAGWYDSSVVENPSYNGTAVSTSGNIATQYTTSMSQAQPDHSPFDTAETAYPNTQEVYDQGHAYSNNVNPAASAPQRQSPTAAGHYRTQRPTSPAIIQNTRSVGPQLHDYDSAQSAVQYADDSSRVLPTITQSSQTITTSAAHYQYDDRHLPITLPAPNIPNDIPTEREQQPSTVDPTQVYDPWRGYQRKMEAANAAKATKEAEKRVEEARKAEETRKIEEALKAEEALRAQEAKRREEERREEERHSNKQQEIVEEWRESQKEPELDDSRNAQASTTAKPSTSPSRPSSKVTAGASERAEHQENLEAEIRALMAKMREYDQKDPGLLARIWEQEQKAHSQRTSTSPAHSPAETQIKSIPPPTSTTQTKSRPESAHGSTQKQMSGVTSSQTPNKPASVPKLPEKSIPSNPPKAAPPKPVIPKSGTIWPEEKKANLALAASNWLNAVPENAKTKISADEIYRMLDSNPSYQELCTRLEGMHLKLDRAVFARALLAACPDVVSNPKHLHQQQRLHSQHHQPSVNPAPVTETLSNLPGNKLAVDSSSSLGRSRSDGAPTQSRIGTSQAGNQPPTASISRANGQTRSVDGQIKRPTAVRPSVLLSQPPRPDQHGVRPSKAFERTYNPYTPPSEDAWYPSPDEPEVRSPYFNASAPQLPHQLYRPLGSIASMPQIGSQSKFAEGSNLPPAPTTKEEAARKRDFSELIDLTMAFDDEIPPEKKLKVSSSQTAASTVRLPVSQVQPSWAWSVAQPVPLLSHTHPRPPYQTYNHSGPVQPYRPSPPFANEPSMSTSQMAEPHKLPAPAPVAKHLAVDDTTLKIRQTEVVKPVDKKKALRRSTYNATTIARDVLLATGKHPEMRPLNAHLEILRTNFPKVDSHSDLATFRWDIVDPGEPVQNDTKLLDGDDADDEDDDIPSAARPVVRPTVSVGGRFSVEVENSVTPFVAAKPKIKRPRGRPPRNSYPTMSRPYGFGDGKVGDAPLSNVHQTPNKGGNGNAGTPRAPQQHEGQATTPKAPSTGPSAPQSTGAKLSGYAAFRQTHLAPDGTPLPKKKGRPVGWRKHLHSAAAVAAQTTQASGTGPGADPSSRTQQPLPAQPNSLQSESSTRRVTMVNQSSPASASRKHPLNTEPEPKYQVYKCQWKDCSAELHNLETLRKHVFKLHNKVAAHGGYDCYWGSCGYNSTLVDRTTGQEMARRQRLDFSTEDKWQEHIEKKHFSPLAWQLGDGPVGGLSDAHDSELSEAYLSDSRGRRVTPRISAATQEQIAEAHAAAARAIMSRGPGKLRKKSDEEKAKELYEAMKRRKSEVGPGIDRGGAILATDERRAEFVDDEDFEELVDADEP